MKPACREKGKYKGVERMKPDSNANTGTFRRIAGRAITAACAIVLTVGLRQQHRRHGHLGFLPIKVRGGGLVHRQGA